MVLITLVVRVSVRIRVCVCVRAMYVNIVIVTIGRLSDTLGGLRNIDIITSYRDHVLDNVIT